jgi:hypothetical protein
MRGSRQKKWRIIWIQQGQSICNHACEPVLSDTVPDIEQEAAARLQDTKRLAISSNPVGEKHRPKLAAHKIEGRLVEWQVESICLLPRNPVVWRLPPGRSAKHRQIQVADDISCIGVEKWRKSARNDARAGSRLQHVLGIAINGAPCDLLCV